MTRPRHRTNELELPSGHPPQGGAVLRAALGHRAGLLARRARPDRELRRTRRRCSMHSLPDLNWAGFYLLRGGELVVGPFQGKPACVRIALGPRRLRQRRPRRARTVVVPDVHAVPGPHRLRLGLELGDRRAAAQRRSNGLLGVLDLDSPKLATLRRGGPRGLERHRRGVHRALRLERRIRARGERC